MTESPSGIFTVEPEEDAELVHPVHGTDWKTIHDVASGGRPPTRPLPVKLVTREADGTALRRVDCPWLGSLALALRPTAVAALGDLLARDGELLPLACRDAPLQLFRAHTILDLLDQERSRIAWFAAGRIMWIEHHVWSRPLPADVVAFRLVGAESIEMYVTGRFVEAYRRANLTGLVFRPAR